MSSAGQVRCQSEARCCRFKNEGKNPKTTPRQEAGLGQARQQLRDWLGGLSYQYFNWRQASAVLLEGPLLQRPLAAPGLHPPGRKGRRAKLQAKVSAGGPGVPGTTSTRRLLMPSAL